LDSYIVDVSRYLKEHVSYTLWLLNMDLTWSSLEVPPFCGVTLLKWCPKTVC
jgi:hypothetical protein